MKGKQSTIGWYVENLKISHVDASVVESIVQQLNNKYGKEEPISVNCENQHDYLGMTIDSQKKEKCLS